MVTITIKDDGCGFNISEKMREGRGMNNIVSRIEAFNGIYDFSSKINKGTLLKVSFPFT